MNSTTQKRLSAVRRGAILVSLLIIAGAAIFLPEAVAKYKSSVSASDGAEVAQFVLDSNMESNIQSTTFELTGLSPTSEKKTFTFMVTNAKDGNVSEVAMKYTVEVKGLGNLPLIYTLSDGSTDQKSTASVSISNSVAASTESQHSYTVTVEWNENATDAKNAKYTEEIDLVTVTLHCEQID